MDVDGQCLDLLEPLQWDFAYIFGGVVPRIGLRTTDNNPLFNLGTKNDGATGQFDFFFRNGGSTGHQFSNAEPFDNEWHHLAWVDVKPEPHAAYNEKIQRDIEAIEPWQAGCNSYYRAASGRVVTQWPHNMGAFEKEVADLDLDAYEVARL